MNEQLHKRANELLMRRRIESLSCEDELWLAAHLEECADCAAQDARMAEALSALRSMPIHLPRNLASRTQLRLRIRAEELREHGPASRLIWAVAGLSWLFGLATAPFVWRGFEWIGGELHLPKLVWAAAVALWWLVPGVSAAALVLFQKRGVAREAE